MVSAKTLWQKGGTLGICYAQAAGPAKLAGIPVLNLEKTFRQFNISILRSYQP
jgi:hypothetical protein